MKSQGRREFFLTWVHQMKNGVDIGTTHLIIENPTKDILENNGVLVREVLPEDEAFEAKILEILKDMKQQWEAGKVYAPSDKLNIYERINKALAKLKGEI